MTDLFNLKQQKQLRRNLRQQEILAERYLWSKLRNRGQGYKFRRQYGIGKYIVDFYCPKLELVIEIDGATHSTEEEIKNDKIRQRYLESLGLTVKRYYNTDIKDNLEGVLVNILNTCKKLEKHLVDNGSAGRRPHPNDLTPALSL